MLTIENVKLADIVPFKKNAKLHPKSQIAQIVSSIREFGFNDPIAISETNEIIEGHGRLLAVKELGYKEVPCIRLSHLSESQRRAYILTHNKLTMNTGFDTDLLLGEFDFLQGADFDTTLTGFDLSEIEKMFADANPAEIKEDEFDVEKAAGEPSFVLRGDLWRLKNHRLLCGDSTDSNDVARLMDGKKANLVLTDMPYFVAYKAQGKTIKNDDLDDSAAYDFTLSALKLAENVMANDASIYIFHADSKGLIFRKAFVDAGFYLSSVCLWVKSNFTFGRQNYKWGHESCLYGWKKSGKHVWWGDQKQSTIWRVDKPSKNVWHITQKPLELMSIPLLNSTMTGAIVYEPFSGSFSTGMVCEQTDRVCYAMELDESFMSASIKRYRESYPDAEITCERGGETLKYTDLVKEVNHK